MLIPHSIKPHKSKAAPAIKKGAASVKVKAPMKTSKPPAPSKSKAKSKAPAEAADTGYVLSSLFGVVQETVMYYVNDLIILFYFYFICLAHCAPPFTMLT